MELTVSIQKRLREFTLAAEFTVRDEVFALLGASGCGKSMTLKCIAGIERPDAGHIELNGRVLFDSERGIDLPPQQRRVGYLFQSYALFPNMTILENLTFVMAGEREEKRRRAAKLLERFRLGGLGDAYPAALSGGQQQRAAFARILATEAELLLLDEPFSALDSYLKWQLELELMDVLGDYDGAALLVSHDRGEVYRLAGRVAVVNAGRMEAPKATKELFRHPQTLAATLLTGCKNVSAVRREGDVIYAEDWQLPLHTAAPLPDAVRYVGIRAHYFRPRREAGENTFLMEVVRVIEDTFSYLVMVRPKGTDALPVRWELGKAAWEELRAEELYLEFPADKLMLMQR